MKTLITAAALSAILAMPAMAEKTPIKPTDTCASEVTYALIMKHLDKIEALLAEMESKPKPVKPVDNYKKL